MTSETEDGADKAWLRKEIINEVDQVINKLPSKYKQVLLLRYYSEKSYEEISEILQKPINTVGTLINRAKKKMNKEVEKNKKKFNLK
jgi:RNA polymerase sigma-70 factor (ECF subfamily)